MKNFETLTSNELTNVNAGGVIGAGVGACVGGLGGLVTGTVSAIYNRDLSKINKHVAIGGAGGATIGFFCPEP